MSENIEKRTFSLPLRTRNRLIVIKR